MDAGFAEYGVTPAQRCLRVPTPRAQMLALLTSGLTASIALQEAGGLALPGFPGGSGGGGGGEDTTNKKKQKKKVVLVTAAAGGTGQFAVQLAKLAGCAVVATCGGARKAALLARLGADRVVDHTREDVKEVLKREYAGKSSCCFCVCFGLGRGCTLQHDHHHLPTSTKTNNQVASTSCTRASAARCLTPPSTRSRRAAT